jgi:hypothetical protein
LNKGASETIFAGKFLSMQTLTHNSTWYWARASPGDAPDIALRLRRHGRILVRAAHLARQRDKPTAVIIVIHEHGRRAELGGGQAPSHQPVT